MTIFEDEEDMDAFERVLEEALALHPSMRMIAHCVMPNHWHLVLYPSESKVLSKFVAWVASTHTRRWHAHRHQTGEGHLYQGRFRSFLVQKGPPVAKVCRYVERNAMRAGLVERAEDWRHGSLWRWSRGAAKQKELLAAWPDPPGRRPAGWLDLVNQPQSDAEEEAIRVCLRRERPYGDAEWMETVIPQFGLVSTLRPQGRPRKEG